MKILITGGNGYIAKGLFKSLKNNYDVTSISRDNFDLTNYQELNSFFQNKYFDLVIHCAIVGGNRLKKDSYTQTDNNLKMYYNLLQHKDLYFSKLIHFGSGAEIYAPDTPFGISKKIISKSSLEIKNYYNIRIFGLFDENEWETRFIKSNIKRYINKKPIIIHQDKRMDFFYMKDLISLVKYYINNDNLPKEINCSYGDPIKLSDIANIINNLDDHKVDIIFENKGYGFDYYGPPNNLLDYIGLEQGIKEMYDIIKNEY